MKFWLLLTALILPALAGDRVTFTDENYSLEFPAGWEKAQSPEAGAEFARQNADGSVLIAVLSSEIPEGAEADLDDTAKKAAETYGKAIQFKGEGVIADGELDGCKAKFITLAPQKPEEGPLAMFMVFVDSKDHFIRIMATMNPQLDKETKEACLEIVKSFRREEAEKKDDGE